MKTIGRIELVEIFSDGLTDIDVSVDARAYITGVLAKYVEEPYDLSRNSVVLKLIEARKHGDFVEHQKLGDWILWSAAVVPSSLGGNDVVILSVGRQSYYTCHRLLNKKWRIYEELADELPRITSDVHRALETTFLHTNCLKF